MTKEEYSEKQNREHKDSVFTDLFQNNPENFLSLYNAIHDTNLKLNEVTLEPKRLEQSLYHTTHNDVSMMINGKWIILIEHQSTINENMPVRLLDYVSKIYEKMIPNVKRYDKYTFYLPEPEFYVFYNGTAPYPDEKILKLSDCFITHSHRPSLELEVTVFNIYKPTTETSLKNLNKCDILKQYCNCIDVIRKIYKRKQPETYDAAIKECLARGYLGEYLIQATKGKYNMLFCEYNYEEDIKEQRRESFEAGEKKKALEDAVIAVKEFNITSEIAAEKMNVSLEELKAMLAEQIKG